MSRALINVTGANTDSAIVTAVSGAAICIDWIEFTVSAAATVSVSNGADGTGTRIFYGDLAANQVVIMGNIGTGNGSTQPLAVLSGNTALNITNSAGNLKGVVSYHMR